MSTPLSPVSPNSACCSRSPRAVTTACSRPCRFSTCSAERHQQAGRQGDRHGRALMPRDVGTRNGDVLVCDDAVDGVGGDGRGCGPGAVLEVRESHAAAAAASAGSSAGRLVRRRSTAAGPTQVSVLRLRSGAHGITAGVSTGGAPASPVQDRTPAQRAAAHRVRAGVRGGRCGGRCGDGRGDAENLAVTLVRDGGAATAVAAAGIAQLASALEPGAPWRSLAESWRDVDGRQTTLRRYTPSQHDSHEWEAAGDIDGLGLAVRSTGISPDELTLSIDVEAEPYIAGTRPPLSDGGSQGTTAT